MTEQSNWMSQRRRSSAALRITGFDSERPSFLAMSVTSMFWGSRNCRVEREREKGGLHFNGVRKCGKYWREDEMEFGFPFQLSFAGKFFGGK